MKRIRLNYIIDIILIIVFFICGITGLLKLPFLFSHLQSLNFRLLTKLHDLSGIIMIILVVVHIALHWKWIITMTKHVFKAKK